MTILKLTLLVGFLFIQSSLSIYCKAPADQRMIQNKNENIKNSSNKKALSPSNENFQERFNPMNKDEFNMTNDDYFDKPLKTFSEIGRNRVQEGKTGLYFSGPTMIEDSREKAPFVIQRIVPSDIAVRVFYNDNAIVCAIDLHTDHLYAAKAVEQKYIRPNRDPNAPLPPPDLWFDGGAVDVFARLGLPRTVGHYAAIALVANLHSKVMTFKIGSKELLSDKIAFEKELKKRCDENSGVVDPPESKSPYPVFSKGAAQTLKDPISIRIPETIVVGKTKEFIVEADLCVFREEMLPITMVTKDDAPPTGIIPLHVVVTGEKTVGPFLYSLNVPVYPAGNDEKKVQATVKFDLFDKMPFGETQQQFYLYFITGVNVSGPFIVDISAK
jgi:hypothetical protein